MGGNKLNFKPINNRTPKYKLSINDIFVHSQVVRNLVEMTFDHVKLQKEFDYSDYSTASL